MPWSLTTCSRHAVHCKFLAVTCREREREGERERGRERGGGETKTDRQKNRHGQRERERERKSQLSTDRESALFACNNIAC